MVISLKGFLGTMFWFFGLLVACFFIAVIAYTLSGDWKKTQEKHKYKGQPIVVNGGKKDEK